MIAPAVATVTPSLLRRRTAESEQPVPRANPLQTMMRRATNGYRARMIPVSDGFDVIKMKTTEYLVKLAMYGVIGRAETALDDIFQPPFKWKSSDSKTRVKKSFEYLKKCAMVSTLGDLFAPYSDLSKAVQRAKDNQQHEDVRGLKVRLEAHAIEMVDRTYNVYVTEYKKTVEYNTKKNKPLAEKNAKAAFSTLGFSSRTDKLVTLDRIPGSEGSVILANGQAASAS